jgi:hypothetical protein
MNTCSIDGCGKPVVAKGMCSMHYARERRNGSPHVVQRDRTVRQCSVAGCTTLARAIGLCNMHYQRHLRGASNVDVAEPVIGGSLLERAARHVPAPDAGGHQVWTSQITGRETPVLKLAHTSLSARRLLWEAAHGTPPPEGKFVTASCGVDRCVAVEHLQLVQPGYHLRKTRDTVPTQ